MENEKKDTKRHDRVVRIRKAIQKTLLRAKAVNIPYWLHCFPGQELEQHAAYAYGNDTNFRREVDDTVKALLEVLETNNEAQTDMAEENTESAVASPNPKALLIEKWQCLVCDEEAPCIVEIKYNNGKLPEYTKENNQRFRRQICICKESTLPDWINIS